MAVWKEVVNCNKYFGLHFTTKLSLTQTVNELATKAQELPKYLNVFGKRQCT